MAMLQGVETIVVELRAERTHLANNLRHVNASLAVLGMLEGGKFATESRHSASARRKIAVQQKDTLDESSGKPQGATSVQLNIPARKRTPSKAARRKMALAQGARWANLKAKQAAKPAPAAQRKP